MKAAWPLENERCEVVYSTEKQVNKKQTQAYRDHDWQRIAPLYGCDNKGNPSERVQIPRVYATIKGKCLPEEGGIVQVLKARPISPHTKVALKKVYNKVATAYLFLLTQLRNQRTSRLWTTQEYAKRVTGELETLEKHRRRALKEKHEM